ncbi:hypothetical protein ACWN8V_10330 [Vagococcus elongatus]|uniref:hypothetical protein n=1 Tax=Vagococcus elongatus TaxID=180344 RepID=UPI001476C03C|nr:hypothetical protein [Vagococcus elongatus]
MEDENDKLLTCGQELGHAVYHPDENMPTPSKKNISKLRKKQTILQPDFLLMAATTILS